MDRDFEIYVHIPFCVRKCGYCAFLSAPSDTETRKSYTRTLLREIRLAAAQMTGEEQAVSVFFFFKSVYIARFASFRYFICRIFVCIHIFIMGIFTV